MSDRYENTTDYLRPIHASLHKARLNLRAEGFGGIAALSGAIVALWFLPSWPLKIPFTLLFLCAYRGLQLLAEHDPQYFKILARHHLRYKRGYSPLPHIDAKQRRPRSHQKHSAI